MFKFLHVFCEECGQVYKNWINAGDSGFGLEQWLSSCLQPVDLSVFEEEMGSTIRSVLLGVQGVMGKVRLVKEAVDSGKDYNGM